MGLVGPQKGWGVGGGGQAARPAKSMKNKKSKCQKWLRSSHFWHFDFLFFKNRHAGEKSVIERRRKSIIERGGGSGPDLPRELYSANFILIYLFHVAQNWGGWVGGPGTFRESQKKSIKSCLLSDPISV